MKKIMVIILAGVMTILMVTGCGNLNLSKKNDNVDVEINSIEQSGWSRTEYIYRSENYSAARKLCEANMYEFLDDGYTVSEMIETTDDNGDRIYKFVAFKKIAE